MKHALHQKEVLLFLIVGASAAASNVGVRFALNEFLSFQASIILAYLAAMLMAFVLNKVFVFKSQKSSAVQLYRFAIVNIVALSLVWGSSLTLVIFIFPAVQMTWYPEDVAHVIAVAMPVIVSYLGHKYYTFID